MSGKKKWWKNLKSIPKFFLEQLVRLKNKLAEIFKNKNKMTAIIFILFLLLVISLFFSELKNFLENRLELPWQIFSSYIIIGFIIIWFIIFLWKFLNVQGKKICFLFLIIVAIIFLIKIFPPEKNSNIKTTTNGNVSVEISGEQSDENKFCFTVKKSEKNDDNKKEPVECVVSVGGSTNNSPDNNSGGATEYFKENVANIREDMRDTKQSMEIFIAIIGVLITIAGFFLGFQFFKNEKFGKELKSKIDEFDKKIKVNETLATELKSETDKLDKTIAEVKKESEQVKKDLAESNFNLALGLAVNKNVISEKLDALEELAKKSEYKIYSGLIYYYMGYYSWDDNYKIEYFTIAIEAFEQNGKIECDEYFESFNLRGDSYFNIGKKDEAKRDYKKVVSLNSASEVIKLSCRGSLEIMSKKYKKAIEYYDEVIKKNPRYWMAYVNRGFAKSLLDDNDGAIKDYNESIRLNPNYSGAYSGRGDAKYGLKKLEEAIQDLDKALEINPNDSMPYNNRGLAKKYLGKFIEALTDYDKTIELNPNFEEAINNRKKLLAEHPELEKK
ncbi:MAG: tetratricopeptide repeat protein [Fusobacteriaceae bacterium]